MRGAYANVPYIEPHFEKSEGHIHTKKSLRCSGDENDDDDDDLSVNSLLLAPSASYPWIQTDPDGQDRSLKGRQRAKCVRTGTGSS